MTTITTIRRQRTAARLAFTLTELMVVVAIVLIVLGIAIPSLSGLTQGSSETAARTMLRGLFTTVKARAANKQEYTAIRFQQTADGRTYAVVLELADESAKYFEDGRLIDPYNNTNDASLTARPSNVYTPFVTDFLVFVAASGMEPFKLPTGVELASGDGMVDASLNESARDVDGLFNDYTTFTIVFSPTGQVVRRRVYVSQRWYGLLNNTDYSDPTYSQGHDMIFNDAVSRNIRVSTSPNDISKKHYDKALLLQPDTDKFSSYPERKGYGPELSRTGMIIYDQQRRKDAGAAAYSGYVATQGQRVQLNLYTGGLIDMQQ